MRVLVASDAWEPQINGVVRTLQQVQALAPEFGVETHFVTPDQFRSFPMPGYPEIRLALAHSGALQRTMARFRPDVVHVATEGPVGLAARNASLAMGIALTTSYHTRFPEYLRARLPIPTALSYGVLRRFHNASSGILVSTPSLENDLRQRGFAHLMRWTRGVDLDLYRPRTHSSVDWPRPIFLNVGRIAVEKNLQASLDLDLPGTKVIVGDGPQREELARRYPDAVFLGALTGQDLAALYAQADVFVFPSRTDTFGVVILEALASGLPVAAYPVIGPADILSGSRAGVLSHDLREAALACLSVEQSECVALAARYSWRASIRQFCTNLDLARQQDATARSPAREACQTFPLGL